MSTFGALNTAYRGLTAAQQGMNVAGQNIANAATEGYTRQRVEQSSIGAPARGLFSGGSLQAGQGVSVDSIARLGSSFLDAGVRSAGARRASPAPGPPRCRASKASCRNPATTASPPRCRVSGPPGRARPTIRAMPAPRDCCWRPATSSTAKSPPPTRPSTGSGAVSAARRRRRGHRQRCRRPGGRLQRHHPLHPGCRGLRE